MAEMRKVIFKDTATQQELLLPVTPSVLEAESGVNIEIINISQLGDVAVPGMPTLAALKIDPLFPARKYPFCASVPLEPYKYVERFKSWAQAGTVLRFIWTGTSVNIPVLIESIRWREDDGTNDVYATITMREHRPVKAELEPRVTVAAVDVEPDRPSENPEPAEQSHKIVWGDTLWSICRTYYGDGSLYPQVAEYNNCKNPNLIPIGTVLKLPARSVLDSMKGPTSSGGNVATLNAEIPTKILQGYSKTVLAMKERQMEGA